MAGVVEQWGPWVLLAYGVVGLVSSTVFAGFGHRIWGWVRRLEWTERAARENAGVGWLLRVLPERFGGRWQAFSVVWSLALIAAAIAWFAWR